MTIFCLDPGEFDAACRKAGAEAVCFAQTDGDNPRILDVDFTPAHAD